MSRRLLPLNQLRSFEAAARHQSFRAAADELHVTHAAVSHQIKALEETLGVALFRRIPRGVVLTDEARQFAGELTEALDHIDGAVRDFESNLHSGTIKISAVPWYANRFILPQLDLFHASNPALRVELEHSYVLADLEIATVDAALRHGDGQWPDLSVRRVHNEILSPVCAPSLVDGKALPLAPSQIVRMPLGTAPGFKKTWLRFFELAGLKEVQSLNFIEFENRALATEFAVAGHGAALPDIVAVADELHAGLLTLVTPIRLRSDTGLFLVSSKSRTGDQRLLKIREWMHDLFRSLPVPEFRNPPASDRF